MSVDFSANLHKLRSEELRRSAPPPPDGVMLSVGCNGSYYFDWIDENLGRPNIHIGLEAYLPRPDDLQAHVHWLAESAANMSGVASGSIDMVFAGQTIEHLWEDELSCFLLETARVLKPEGRFILDSPNEPVAQRARWNHPEHTIEMRPAEAAELLAAAGFTIDRMVGHWLCHQAGVDLDLRDTSDWDHRNIAGLDLPDDCFSWWIEAHLTGPANPARVIRLVHALWERNLNRRIERMMQTTSPDTETTPDGVRKASAAAGWAGYLLFGPFAPLPPGRSIVSFTIDPYDAPASPGIAEIFHTIGDTCLAQIPLPARHVGGALMIAVDLPSTTFGVEYRIHVNGLTSITVALRAELQI